MVDAPALRRHLRRYAKLLHDTKTLTRELAGLPASPQNIRLPDANEHTIAAMHVATALLRHRIRYLEDKARKFNRKQRAAYRAAFVRASGCSAPA